MSNNEGDKSSENGDENGDSGGKRSTRMTEEARFKMAEENGRLQYEMQQLQKMCDKLREDKSQLTQRLETESHGEVDFQRQVQTQAEDSLNDARHALELRWGNALKQQQVESEAQLLAQKNQLEASTTAQLATQKKQADAVWFAENQKLQTQLSDLQSNPGGKKGPVFGGAHSSASSSPTFPPPNPPTKPVRRPPLFSIFETSPGLSAGGATNPVQGAVGSNNNGVPKNPPDIHLNRNTSVDPGLTLAQNHRLIAAEGSLAQADVELMRLRMENKALKERGQQDPHNVERSDIRRGEPIYQPQKLQSALNSAKYLKHASSVTDGAVESLEQLLEKVRLAKQREALCNFPRVDSDIRKAASQAARSDSVAESTQLLNLIQSNRTTIDIDSSTRAPTPINEANMPTNMASAHNEADPHQNGRNFTELLTSCNKLTQQIEAGTARKLANPRRQLIWQDNTISAYKPTEAGGKEAAEQWSYRLDIVFATIADLEETDKITKMTMLLTEHCYSFVQTVFANGCTPTYVDFKSLFLKRYGDNRSFEAKMAEFRRCRQSDKTVSEYFEEVQSKIARLFPDLSAAAESIIICQLTDGLSQEILKVYLNRHYDEPAGTIDQLRRWALEAEAMVKDPRTQEQRSGTQRFDRRKETEEQRSGTQRFDRRKETGTNRDPRRTFTKNPTTETQKPIEKTSFAKRLYSHGGVEKPEKYLEGEPWNHWLLAHPPREDKAIDNRRYEVAKSIYERLCSKAARSLYLVSQATTSLSEIDPTTVEAVIMGSVEGTTEQELTYSDQSQDDLSSYYEQDFQ